jgi:molybdate transport system substrate-binding protein
MRCSSLVGLLLGALLLAGAGCGTGDSGGSSAGSGGSKPTLTVSAAASLNKAFTAYGRQFHDATARFSFAGSDELAAQIRQGIKPDVYAAANTKLPEQLYAKGLVEKPTVFAGNRLVLAVPSGQTKVGSLADIEKPGVTVAVGSASVPVGSYTRKVLDKLPGSRRHAILTNVRSEEPDVAGIVGKLTQGAVDAGFVYISDVRGAGGRLKAIELPADLQPSVAYGAAVVKGAQHPAQAKAFIDGLVSGAGERALKDAGFEPPPSG